MLGAGDGTVAVEMQTLGANLTAVLVGADDKEQCQLAATAMLYTYKLLPGVGYTPGAVAALLYEKLALCRTSTAESSVTWLPAVEGDMEPLPLLCLLRSMLTVVAKPVLLEKLDSADGSPLLIVCLERLFDVLAMPELPSPTFFLAQSLLVRGLNLGPDRWTLCPPAATHPRLGTIRHFLRLGTIRHFLGAVQSSTVRCSFLGACAPVACADAVLESDVLCLTSCR